MKNYFKLFLMISILFFASSTARAENIEGLGLDKAKYIPKNFTARALADFSSDNPSKTFEMELLQKTNPTTNTDFTSKGFIKGNIIKVVNEKIGKQDAYFLLEITAYKADNDSEYRKLETKNPVKVKAYKPFDGKDTGLKVGTSIAGKFVKNVAYPINFTRGLIEPYEDKNRLESAVQRTYEGSYFSYASKGKNLVVQKGGLVSVSMKGEKEEDSDEDDNTEQATQEENNIK